MQAELIMKKINFTTDVLPHLLAVGIFLIVTVSFFNPIFFDNRVLEQHDIQQFQGAAHSLLEYRAETGEEGLWANNMFSGMPAYLVNLDWSDGVMVGMKKVISLALPHPVNNIFLAFVCYYILLLSFGVRHVLAIAGALAFGLSSFQIIGLGAGHNARIGAIAFMPLVMAGIHLTFSNKRLLGFGVMTAGLAFHLRENHVQITYYLILIVLGYGLMQMILAIQFHQLKTFITNILLLIPAALIATLTFFGPMWAITEYSKYSIRGPSEIAKPNQTDGVEGLSKSRAFEYSNGISEPLTLLIPNYLGGSTGYYLVQNDQSATFKALSQSQQETANQLAQFSRAYWGPQSNTAPYYAGAIICFLFLMGIVFAEKNYTLWLVPLSLLAVTLSWGDNFQAFNYFMFDFFPAYNKFRSVTFALVIIIFAMPLLGMLGLENLLKQGWGKSVQKKLIIPVVLTGGFCLVLALTGGFGSFFRPEELQLPAWFTNALRQDRVALLRSDAWRSFWFIAVAGALLFSVLKKWINPTIFAWVLVVLVAFDLGFISRRYLTPESYIRKRDTSFFLATEADQEIARDKGVYRVYNLQSPFQEARTSYHHQSLGGYHGAKMRRYQDLYDSGISKDHNALIQDAQTGAINFEKYTILNLLNTRYIVYGPARGNIIVNPSAYGNAWYVRDVERVNSPSEEIVITCSIVDKERAVVDDSQFKIEDFEFDSAATIQLTEQKPAYLRYESESSVNGFAVFSEIFYPKGWRAVIDGKAVEILRSNYVLRALHVPAGKHSIEFFFEPEPYIIGNKITQASSWLVLLIVIGCLGGSMRKTGQSIPESVP